MIDLSRRGFLRTAIPALICAPAIVRASSLMRLPPPSPRILTLLDWAKMNDPSGIEEIAKFLTESNDILATIPWQRAA